MDLFYFFFHLALVLCKSNGTVAFITTNYYPTATGALKLRKDFHDRATIQKLINFNELKIFESAQGQHNMITLLTKGVDDNASAETCITKRTGFATSDVLYRIVNGLDEETDYFTVQQKHLYDENNYQIRLIGLIDTNGDSLHVILVKIKSQGVELGSLCNVNNGVITGADKISKKHLEKFHIKAKAGDGIFILSPTELEEVDLNYEVLNLLKPWFKNSDVFRWGTRTNSPEKIMYLNRSTVVPQNVLHLLGNYREILSDRREVRNNVINWWQLQWPRTESIFLSKKIVAPQRSPRNTFGYNEIPWYASADVYFITERDDSVKLKYILALLNSKLYFLWLYHRGKRKGETLELYQTPLSEIPIKKIPVDQQQPFVDIVDMILDQLSYVENQGGRLISPSVKVLEDKLNHLIYELYQLTETEIAYVESINIP